MSDHKGRIAYILRKFPVLSETFILNEILALEALGIPIHIFALQRPNDSRFHENLPKLKSEITYVPSPQSYIRSYIRRHRYVAKRYKSPYFRTLTSALAQGRSSLFPQFLQSGYIAHMARKLKIHHFHAHFATEAASAALLTSEITGIPYSFTAHAVDIFKQENVGKILIKKIQKAQFVVTVSDFNKHYLEQMVPEAKNKIHRFYNGIDLERYVPGKAGLHDPFTMLCVSRLVEKKGLPVLIEACRMLRDRGLAFKCGIVGGGPLRPNLEAMIREKGLQDQVQLFGPLTQLEVLNRYHAADLFVLPCVVAANGNRDGLPVSIVESLACGLPVVTTPITGNCEVVRHRHNGLLFPEGNSLALADAVQSLIDDSTIYNDLKRHARDSVIEKFNIRKTSQLLSRIFSDGPAFEHTKCDLVSAMIDPS